MATALLLTDKVNIDYLTGFRSSNAFLIKTGKTHLLFTDGRYLEKAHRISGKGNGRVGSFQVINMGNDLKETLKKLIRKHRLIEIHYEGDIMTVNQLQRFKKLFPGTQWKNGTRVTEAKRATKDASEISALKRSQTINEQVFYSARALLKPGVTEVAIAQAIKRLAHEHGADDISFEPIIGFGSHSSMPHHENTSRKLKKGELVLIDMGVLYKGYASDMTRMVFTKSPTPLQEKIYTLVLDAQEAAIQKMKPGMKCAALDHIARSLLAKADYEEYFCHSLGHGIGLEVHEAPTLSSRSKDVLKPGMVVTSEPGIYLADDFGVRIEDMILITPAGHQNLTRVPKGLKDCILKGF